MTDDDEPEPVKERRLPPSGSCQHCGKWKATWTCSTCYLDVCDQHDHCPECDCPR